MAMGRPLVALVLALLATPLMAQDAQDTKSDAGDAAVATSGVPANVILRPGADRAARVSLDEPAGAPRYRPRLPRGTPDDQLPGDEDAAGAEAARPVADFVSALDRAYWTHPSLLAARARLRSTDFRVPEAKAGSGPRLDFEASYGFLRSNSQSIFSPGWNERSGWTSAAKAVLSQPVFTFGRTSSAVRGAMAEVAYQRSVLRSTEAQVLFNAVRAYAGLLRDTAALEIYQDDLDLLEREYADNAARFTTREVTSSDVQQVETRVEQSRAQLYSAQRTAANAQAEFLGAVGAPAGDLAPPNPLAMPVGSLEDAYAYAEMHSPVLAAAYARERASRASVASARADMLPRVDLRGTAEYGSVSPYNDSLRQSTLRGEVVVSGPLFESGLRRARMQEAEAANDADWRLIDNALRENRIEVAEAWNEWLVQSAMIEQLRLSAVAARKAYDGALLQEKAGFRTTLDVLNLARELLVARSSYNAATANAYVAQARLLAAIGALDRGTLFPDAPAYDPDEHFDRTKNDGELPLIVPLMRKIDGLVSGGGRDRALRDPAAPLAPAGVNLPVPATEQAPSGE